MIFENVERAEIKKRLTHKQRLELFQLEAMRAVIESFAKQFDKDCILDKETAKYVKTAISYLEKAINKILGEIDEDEKNKYTRWVRKFRIAFLDTEKIIDRDAVKKLERYGDKYVLTEEEFLNLAEHAIEVSCKNCNKEDYKNCRFYKVMWELDVDPQSQEGCPYRMEAKV